MIENEKEFELLLEQITKNTGFDCRFYKEKYLRRRIQYRLDCLRIRDFGQYKEYLNNDRDEYTALLNSIGVNVSEFFRDPSVYFYLENNVFPELIASSACCGVRKIIIWSAPCATGEEPYSLAMLAALTARRAKWTGTFVVHATDIDEEALAKARKGQYPAEASSGIPGYMRKSFLENGYDGGYFSVASAVSGMVRFKRHDLIAEPPLGTVDLLCHRNMLIYVKQEYHSTIIRKLYDALRPGGFLVLGKTEFLPESHAELFNPVSSELRIYRKKESSTAEEK